MTDEINRLKQEIARLRKVISDLSPSLDALLRKRGLRIYKKEPKVDLLIPEKFIDRYYRMLHKYSFRLFLRDVIKFQKGFTIHDVTRYASPEVTTEYVAYLKKIGLIKKTLDRFVLVKPIKSFGETLEWFFAEILKREFLMEALWGVRFKKPETNIFPPPSGDFDVIAKLNGLSILYAEVKSSPPKQIYQKEIKAFLNRVESLKPELSIFFMDTELRMKDKIVPMFEEELGPNIERIEKEIFHAHKRIFIMNSKDSIIHNIETVLSWYYKNK